MVEEKMSFHNEKKVISSHNDDKAKAIKTRFTIEALSFMGICIGFSLSLYNTYRSYRNLNQQLNDIN
jgi:hypothetical protein